jgi:hypothetical protein
MVGTCGFRYDKMLVSKRTLLDSDFVKLKKRVPCYTPLLSAHTEHVPYIIFMLITHPIFLGNSSSLSQPTPMARCESTNLLFFFF